MPPGIGHYLAEPMRRALHLGRNRPGCDNFHPGNVPPMPEPFWSVARTQPQREAYAGQGLDAAGFEVLLPRIATKRSTEPLFRGYLFLRIVDRWRAAEATFGVLALIQFGEAPAKVPDREIEALRSRMDAVGVIRLPPEPPPATRRAIAPGARVRITAGPFGGMSGLYAGQSSGERELVLLAILGAVRPVAIAAGMVVPQQ